MKRVALLSALVVCLLAIGCSDGPMSPVVADSQTPASSLTALGWPDNMAGEDLNPALATANWMPDDSLWKYDVIMVTIVWGNALSTSVYPNPNAPLVEWSGGLWINGVVYLDPRMLISFEPGQDSLLVGNVHPQIGWISYTKGDIDGITFAMYVDRTVVYVVEPELHFETVQTNIAWSLSRLYCFDSLYVVNNTNLVAIHSRRVEQTCMQGLIAGDWIKADASHGTFEGIWGGPASNLQGQLNGRFWTTDEGDRLLDGEWIDPVANVVGAMKGRWEYLDPTMCPLCGEGHGYLKGTVTFPEATRLPIRLVGEFGQFGAVTDTLPIRGRWQTVCNTASVSYTD